MIGLSGGVGLLVMALLRLVYTRFDSLIIFFGLGCKVTLGLLVWGSGKKAGWRCEVWDAWQRLFTAVVETSLKHWVGSSARV